MITSPMLAASIEDISLLKYPLLATPKLDGIRCLIVEGRALTRHFKRIPNHYIRNVLASFCPMDGELISGANFQTTTSAVMTEEGIPTFKYVVFDYLCDYYMPYFKRVELLKGLQLPNWITILDPFLIKNESELLIYEQNKLEQGYEGIILRSHYGPYKCGRSTLKEGYMMKLKRFSDSEATIIGFIEQFQNNNKQTENELGNSKRSSAQDNLSGKDTLGSIMVKDLVSGVEFKIGTGFNAEQRKEIWSNRSLYMMKTITYKYQKHGVKILPRCPVFKGFRND